MIGIVIHRKEVVSQVIPSFIADITSTPECVPVYNVLLLVLRVVVLPMCFILKTLKF